MKITEKLHGQCFWLLTVACGVVLNDHLKMLELFMSFMFVTGKNSLNLFALRHIFVRQFIHGQFLCVTEKLYVCWLKLFWT